jgi:erythronate-4-phosphate dehydrogenase
VAEYVLAALFDWWENPEIEKSSCDIEKLCIGIVGAGNVGTRVKSLCDALDIPAFCYDPFKPEWAHTKFEDLRTADVLSFHTPLTKSGPFPTYHLADQQFLKSLKPGALLLNSARGSVVDNTALLEVLKQGQALHVCLDVWEGEPNINRELAAFCYLATPHIAGYSYDGKVTGTRMLYQALCQHLGLKCLTQASTEGVHINIPQSKLLASKSAVATCIRHAYSIREDDACLRALLATAEGVELARGFDGLRKNYPERREFSCYTFRKEGLALREQECLEKIGFMPS